MAKRVEAAKQADTATLVAGAAGPPHPKIGAALGEHTGNVAGIGNPIDRGHREPQDSAAKAADESRGVIDEG
jgi:hypothetical protein